MATTVVTSKLLGLSCYIASALIHLTIRRYKTTKRLLNDRNVNAAIARIETTIQRDEGKRGIAPLCIPGELANAAESIMKAKRIAIITGFPCLLDFSPPTETDGPLGALAIARACLALGKRVYIVTDECNEDVVLGSAAAADLNKGFAENCDKSQINGSSISSKYLEGRREEVEDEVEDEVKDEVDIYDEKEEQLLTCESYPGGANFTWKDDERLFDFAQNIDLVIAIERAGPSKDGTYRTMRKRDMTGIVAPLDRLITGEFVQLYKEENYEANIVDSIIEVHQQRIKSIGIGDGGNEVGMGKVFDTVVKSSIPNAPDIACVTKCDSLITASVSNWGGYALAAAVALTATSEKYPIFLSIDEAVSRCMPNREQETIICQRMVDCGGRDGMTAKNELMVDGMPLERSIELLEEIADIALKANK